MMFKRKWTPLSPQVRIAEALNTSAVGLSLVDLQAHEFLHGLSAHAVAINLKILARRGEVVDHPSNGFRVFVLTPRGKQQIDFQRICRAKLARRLKIDIPAGTYPAQTVPQPVPSPQAPAEAVMKPLTQTALISRAHLRLLVNRALANREPLTEDDRAALAEAIREAA